jgi:hypothetical protein
MVRTHLGLSAAAEIPLSPFGPQTIRWTGSDNAEQHEAAGRGGAEYHRRVTAHKVRRSREEFFYGLTAHGLRKRSDLLSYSPRQTCQLRRVLVETIRCHPYRLRNAAYKIGASLDLLMHEPLCLFASLRGERGRRFSRLTPRLLNGLSEL